MDVEKVLEGLRRALALQNRSALQYTVSSASLFGLEFQGIGERLWAYAQDELADARQLVEKIVAIGGEPTVDVAPMRFSGDPAAAVEWLIEAETEAVEALKDIIEHTGNDGRSEALEHLLEHLIMRKQNQLDFLLRARRQA